LLSVSRKAFLAFLAFINQTNQTNQINQTNQTNQTNQIWQVWQWVWSDTFIYRLKMWLELAKIGQYNGKKLTRPDFEQVVETFQGEVPVTLGHSFADFMPAFGWVKAVKLEDETLHGDVDLLPPLKDAYDKGFFKKWSIGLRRNSEGKKYLHHLAFLGSVPPLIKDLKPVGQVAFSDDVEIFEFAALEADKLGVIARAFTGLREWLLEKFGREDADKVVPPCDLDWLKEPSTQGQNFADTPLPLSKLPIAPVGTRLAPHNEKAKRILQKYGWEGLKKYSLLHDPDKNPESLEAYKYLVVDIIDNKPQIIPKAVSQYLAYLHGARGVKIPDEDRRIVEPKLLKLKERIDKEKKKEEPMKFSDLPKEEQERLLAEAKAQVAQEFADKERALTGELLAQKKRELEEAIKGRVPKEKHPLVLALADAMSPVEKMEFSDGDTKYEKSPLDVLIEIFKALPLPVQPGEQDFGDPPTLDKPLGDLTKYM